MWRASPTRPGPGPAPGGWVGGPCQQKGATRAPGAVGRTRPSLRNSSIDSPPPPPGPRGRPDPKLEEPSRWRTGGCAGWCGGRFSVFAADPLRTHARCRVSAYMRPNTSTPPSAVLVVHHGPPRHVGLRVGRRKPPTTLWVARAHGAPLDGRGWRALRGWLALVCG